MIMTCMEAFPCEKQVTDLSLDSLIWSCHLSCNSTARQSYIYHWFFERNFLWDRTQITSPSYYYTLNPKIQNNITGPAIAQWLTHKNSETTMILVGVLEKAALGQLIL